MKMKRSDCSDDGQDRKRPRLDVWGDDLCDDMLEEVCIMAELTQTVPVVDDAETENRKLKEALKMKEGEVGILRSQLQQQQNAKQNDAINNLRAMDRLEEKNRLGVEGLKKQIEQLQGELQFKDLEVKTLVEKCKQMEVKSPGSFLQPVKKMGSCEVGRNGRARQEEKVEKSEGEKLREILDPSFARCCPEPSVIPMFECKASYQSSLDLAKSDKYKWVGLPRVREKYPELIPVVLDLMKCDTFEFDAINQVVGIFRDVFRNLLDLLNFLKKLPISVEKDRALLANTDPGEFIGLSDILSEKLLDPLEKAVEARRTLAIVCCIVSSSQTALNVFATTDNVGFLAGIVEAIGMILRPLEFAGVSHAICIFLQILLERTDNLNGNLTKMVQKMLGDLIMTRPKLPILREIIATLCASSRHKDLQNLCKRSPPESSTVCMDSRLQQALFVTHEACPLELLQIQVTTLSHLSESPPAIAEMTNIFTQWLHSVLANSYPQPPGWLFHDKKCCNILKSFCHLLTLLVAIVVNNPSYKDIFERAIMTLRDCCKGHQKKLKQATIELLPFKIRSCSVLDLLSPRAREAAFYVISEYEADVVTQETSAGPALHGSET